jgi:pantothenate kinase
VIHVTPHAAFQRRKSEPLTNLFPGKYEKTDPSTRVLIAISGLPGSGKTTASSSVVKRLNERYHKEWRSKHSNSSGTAEQDPDIAYYVPLDGYHLTRAQLAAMPDPEEAAYRRGAPFTFDGRSYFELVKKLRARILPETTTIYAPSFDHAMKDPVENDIPIPPTARVVVLEGLYVALDEEPWRDAANLMDELWFVDVPVDIAIERLVKRHVAAGLSPDAKHARARVMASDMRNGQHVLDHRLQIHEIIRSIDDDAFKPTDAEIKEAAEDAKRPTPDRLGSTIKLATDGAGC